MNQMRECSIIIMTIMLHELPRIYMSISKPKNKTNKNNSITKGDYMIKHTKNELRIFIHRFKKKNNRKREQKLVYRAMIF